MSNNNTSPNADNNSAPILPKRSQSRVVLGSGRSPSNSFSNGFVRAAPAGKKTNIILTGHMRTALNMKEEENTELEKPMLVPNLSLAGNSENVRQAVYLKLSTNRRMSDVLHDRPSTKSRELPNLETKQISRSFEDVPMPVHSSSPRKSRDQNPHAEAPGTAPADSSRDESEVQEISSHVLAGSPETSHVLMNEEEFLEYIRERQLEYGDLELEVDHVIIDESDSEEENDTEDLLTPIAELQLTPGVTALDTAVTSSLTPVTAPLPHPDIAVASLDIVPPPTTESASVHEPIALETSTPEPSQTTQAPPVTVPTPSSATTPSTMKLLPWSLNSVRGQLDVLTDIDEPQKGVLWHLFSHVHALVTQFEQASEEWRVQSVNDTLNPPIGVQVRAQLCTVLASVFGDNFNSWRLFGQYHFWDYILAATSAREVEGTALVHAVHQLKAVPDPNVKFRQLMCAGLNAKQLDQWIGTLFGNKEQTQRFYYDVALPRRHPKLICLALQPLAKLPFVLDPDFDSRYNRQ